MDLGGEKSATLSSGIAIGCPHFMKKVEEGAKKLQKQLSRRRKGSKNYWKQKVMIRGKYMKLRNMREDLLDRASAAMAKLYDAIIVDGPNVQGMMHNQPLSRGIRDASFYAFKLKLKWKAEKYGRNMIEICRFDPSSKMCYQCGNIKHGLKPSDRTYRCDACGLVIDRGLQRVQEH